MVLIQNDRDVLHMFAIHEGKPHIDLYVLHDVDNAGPAPHEVDGEDQPDEGQDDEDQANYCSDEGDHSIDDDSAD
uniref:Uncharacterized protein n=1 Tax=Nelumbo nucifera TaxID=4432 RepID=A0A822YLC3_NELNU|nr:TPA_asm: hypothetical protein HUJ06_011232 [Nelumbo nucifera]